MLSGIQHFRFCPRQWALIHVEQQWQENHLTLQGLQLHHKADQPLNMDVRDGALHLRSVALVSHALGMSGIADVLELTPSSDGSNTIAVPRHPGQWRVTPIEYKHGRSKRDQSDDVQLCAQAICLEEMYGIRIEGGCIFYAATRRRKPVTFTAELRRLVADLAEEMHQLMASGVTPSAQPQPKCRSCSLKDLCMVDDLQRATTVKHYLKQLNADEETA